MIRKNTSGDEDAKMPEKVKLKQDLSRNAARQREKRNISGRRQETVLGHHGKDERG
jgi:hypothetical protein